MLGKRVPDFTLASTGRGSSPGTFKRPLCGATCRKVRGVERSPFVITAEGVLERECRGIKVPGHAQEVSNFAKAL
jgi:hypothetical protein